MHHDESIKNDESQNEELEWFDELDKEE